MASHPSATADGTDCFPRGNLFVYRVEEFRRTIRIDALQNPVLFQRSTTIVYIVVSECEIVMSLRIVGRQSHTFPVRVDCQRILFGVEVDIS